MIATSFSKVRQNFKKYCDKTEQDFETIVITRERGENVVMMSESQYNNMLENLYIRSNSKFYNELLESIKQINEGKYQERKLIEYED